jgi:hypothetical protein
MNNWMAAICLTCLVACGGGGGDSPTNTPPNLFVGDWSCSRQASYTFAAPPELASLGTIDNVESSVLHVTAAGSELTMRELTESGAICQMSFVSNGATATVAGGQTCTLETMTLTYKTGTVKVGAYEMRFEFTFDAAGTISVSGTIVTAVAVGTHIASCYRIRAADGGALRQEEGAL